MIRTNTTPSANPTDPSVASDETQGFLPQVGLLALDRQYATLRNEIRAAIERVCDSGRFILGPDVTDLETDLARLLGVPHAISCASGSDALLLALSRREALLLAPHPPGLLSNLRIRLGAAEAYGKVTGEPDARGAVRVRLAGIPPEAAEEIARLLAGALAPPRSLP